MARGVYVKPDEQLRLFTNVKAGANGARNYAILRLLYGYPLRGSELIKLKTHDISTDEGKVKSFTEKSMLRKFVSFTGEDRPLVLVAKPIIEALQGWIDFRLENDWGSKDGILDIEVPFFLANKSDGFSPKSPESFNRLIRNLHKENGIEDGNADTPLRTWTLSQYEKGTSLKYLWYFRGDKSITTVRNTCRNHPLKLSRLIESIV